MSREASLRFVLPIATGKRETTQWVFALAWRRARALMVSLAVCALLSSLLPIAVAWIGKWIVDEVTAGLAEPQGWGQHKHALMRYVLAEALAMLVLLSVNRTTITLQSILRLRLGASVQEQILHKVHAFPLQVLETADVQDLLLRARREAGVRPAALLIGLFSSARDLTLLISSVFVLLSLSTWAAAVVVLAGLPAFFAEVHYSSRRFLEEARRTQDWKVQHYLENTLMREDHQRELRALNIAEPLLERFFRLTRTLHSAHEETIARRTILGVLLGAASTAVFYFGYFWIVKRTVNEHLTLGQMTLYLLIFRQAQTSVTQALASAGTVLDEYQYLKDVRDFLGLSAPTRSVEPAQESEKRGIELEHVSFAYPDSTKLALRDVSLSIAPGEVVVVVGQNGSGKSTLIHLLLGLYPPSEGRVLIDGHAAEQRNAHAAAVFQEPLRLKLSARDNLALAPALARDGEYFAREVEPLADELGLGFVRTLPDGWDTPLGKAHRGGRELSGGEWQRLAILRALLRRETRYLFLDEPTSALDPAGEESVIQTLLRVRGERTLVFVTHRMRVAPFASRIIVMKDGRVVEQGTHAELSRNGTHYALWMLA